MSERHFQHWPRYVPRNITLPQTSLWVNAAVAATRYPDKPCIIFYDSVLPYRDFTRDAERLAGFLQRECGIGRGDRVALYMHNSPQFVIAYYAILRADAVVVPVNPMLLSDELELIVADSGARVAIAPQDLFAQVEPLLSRRLAHVVVACYADYLPRHSEPVPPEMVLAAARPVRGAGVTLWSKALARDLRPDDHCATIGDLCVLPYTSGTTGVPKGCMHTHRSVMHTTVTMALWGRMNPDDRCLAALPLFHVTGMQNAMNVPIYVGGTTVVLPRWNRHAAAALIRQHRITRFSAVPTMMVDLLSSPELDQYDLSSLVSTGGGGAAMPEAVAAKLHSWLKLSFVEGYGLSETIAPSHINPEQNPKRQCLGIPICNTESRVVDPATLSEVAPGEQGEIVTHGPGVFEGYWNNAQATQEAFVQIDGKRFLRTGDLGRIDADGYFFFVDRIKRMINAAGFKVWPAEVESALYGHPAVQEAAVISSRDPRRGETVKAVIVLQAAARGRTSPEQIIDWARAHMAAYKVPRVIEFAEQLPKSMAGKILWRELQERENRMQTAHAKDGS